MTPIGRRRSVGVALMLSITLTLGFSASAQARPGDLDTSFGLSGGFTLTGTPPRLAPSSPSAGVEVLGDGSTIELYRALGKPQVIHRKANGEIDSTFGENGYLTVPVRDRRAEKPGALARDGDHTILLTSGTSDRLNDFFLRRFDDQTGKFDPGFGDGGVARVSLSAILPGQNQGVSVEGFGLDDQGRIYVGAGVYDPFRTVVFRLTPDGEIDRSFGTSGFVAPLVAPCGGLESVHLTPQGILLSGYDCLQRLTFDGELDPTFDNEPLEVDSDSIYETLLSDSGEIFIRLYRGGASNVRKINPDGSIDVSFGVNGTLDTERPGMRVWDAGLDSSGRIIAVGGTWPDESRSAVARFTANGDPDPTFAGGGILEFDLAPGESERLLWIDGGIQAQFAFAVVGAFAFNDRLVMIRLDGENTPDPTFGTDGLVNPEVLVSDNDEIFDLAAAPGGKTVAVGKLGSKALVARYLPSGRLDTSFATDGQLAIPGPGVEGGYVGQRVAVQADGKLLVCLGGWGTQVARITADGRLDPAFGSAGIVALTFDSCAGIAELKGGKVLVAGRSPQRRPVLTRLKATGEIDSSYGKAGQAAGPVDSVPFDRKFTFAPLKGGAALVATGSSITRFDSTGKPVRWFGKKGVVNLLNRKKEPLVTDPGALAIAPQGGIFLAGNDNRELQVAKFTIDGKQARRFAKNGLLEILHPDLITPVYDLAIQADGRPVLAAGGQEWCRGNDGCLEKIRVYRLTRNGKKDPSFGNAGVAMLNPGQINSRSSSVLLTAEGLLLGGFAETQPGNHETVLLRMKK